VERRTFIAGAGAVLLTVPLTTQAQRAGKVHLVGMIHTSSPDLHMPLVDAFRQGLRELGWVEGRTSSLNFGRRSGTLISSQRLSLNYCDSGSTFSSRRRPKQPRRPEARRARSPSFSYWRAIPLVRGSLKASHDLVGTSQG